MADETKARMIIHILVWQFQLVPGWVSFYFAWRQGFIVHGSLVLVGISIMAIYYTFRWQNLSLKNCLTSSSSTHNTCQRSGLLSFSVPIQTLEVSVCRRAGLKSFGREGFCSSLPVELHGSTISQLEEDRREDKVCSDCKASSSSWGRFWNIWLESISF